MDPVSSAASVLALFSFALASTKFIHQVISSIKNGPAYLCTFIREVETLQKVLEQFLAYKNQAPSSGIDLEIVTSLVNACNDDLTRYEKGIEKVRPSSEGKMSAFCKRFKSFGHERDILRMQKEISYHATKLGNQLGILQRYVLLLYASWTVVYLIPYL